MKQGDIYILGNHRLACGDCTDPEFVRKAVGDEKIRAILTDPPYGVAYVESKAHFNKNATPSEAMSKPIANDQLQTDEQYQAFTQKWLEAVTPHLASYNQAYIFNSDLMMCALRAGMRAADFYYSQMIIWIKNSVVVGRKDYLPQHEVIAYGWYGRHKMERSKSKSVIFHPRPVVSRLHPTQKPIGLLRKLLLDSTKIGDVVYDPFGGSGSTLIACEHLQRRCIMIELDAQYCQTIIERWEKISGGKAQKI